MLQSQCIQKISRHANCLVLIQTHPLQNSRLCDKEMVHCGICASGLLVVHVLCSVF